MPRQTGPSRKTSVLLSLLLVLPASLSYAEDREPTLGEYVETNLVIVEVLVVDKEGNVIGDLTRSDFELRVKGKHKPIAVFEANCPAAHLDAATGGTRSADVTPVGPGGRRIVFAFDVFQPGTMRDQALRYAEAMITQRQVKGEQVMIALLGGSLQVVQEFTDDTNVLLAALDGLYDNWPRFPWTSRASYLLNLEVLADILGAFPGPKAVLLFSHVRPKTGPAFEPRDDILAVNRGRGPVSRDWMPIHDANLIAGRQNSEYYRATFWNPTYWDSFYFLHPRFVMTDPVFFEFLVNKVSERATASRVSFYPVTSFRTWTDWRLARDSGGWAANSRRDPTAAYGRMQRDFACRYGLGFYADASDVGKSKRIRVRVDRKGVRALAPRWFYMRTDAERLAARKGAAKFSPGLFLDPDLKVSAVAMRPASARKWKSVLVFDLSLQAGVDGIERDIEIHLDGRSSRSQSVVAQLRLPKEENASTRQVTLVTNGTFAAGAHELVITLTDPDGNKVHTADLPFRLSTVEPDGLWIGGPILARTEPADMLYVMNLDGGKGSTRLDGRFEHPLSNGSLEPLIAPRLESSEEFVGVVDVCVFKPRQSPPRATVTRRIRSADDGSLAYGFDPAPLDLVKSGKAHCDQRRDRITGGSLPPGDYLFEIEVVQGSGPVERKEAAFSIVAEGDS